MKLNGMYTIVTLWLVCLLAIISYSEAGMARFPDYSDHPCRRECKHPAKPMTCAYNFTIEWYYAMSKACYGCPFNMTDCEREHCIPLNGVPRSLSVVNRMFPGPSVEVCKGDTIKVLVTNHLRNGEGSSIHWHGFPQRNTPYMDGVSMVTQCPIAEYTNFQYEMVAEHPGTHWWHSHSGMQRSDGIFGALVVRESRQVSYDYNHQGVP